MKEALTNYIKEGLKQEVEKEFDSLKAQLLTDLESKKNQICSGILLDVMKTVDIQQMQDRIVFTIREITK